MARISIKDLAQSDDLDREAMRSIVGAGPTGARALSDPAKTDNGRIVDYPPGFCVQGTSPTGLKRP